MTPPTLFATLQGYDRRWIRLDIVAGVATGSVVIPQAMAYASLAGLPPEVGLYTCMLPMIVYALLGGSHSLSMSTTSTIAMLTAVAVAALPDTSDPERAARAAFTLAALVGACLVLMWLLKLGNLVEQISPATLTGVKTGVGLTVAVTQLPAALGMAGDAEEEGFFRSIADLLSRLDTVTVVTAVVSAVALTLLLVLRKVAPQVPGPLLVVVGAIVLVALTDVETAGLELIDPISRGLPHPSPPVGGDVLPLLPSALAIALMAFMETVLVARTQRRRDEPQIDANRELLANGLAALAGGLSQTVAPAGGFSQSAVNAQSGARSQLAGIATAVLAVLVALFLGPVLDLLPQAILAVIVLVAVVGLVQPQEFARLWRIDRTEFGVAVVAAVAGLTVGLLAAVAVGVVLVLVLVLRAVSQSQAEIDGVDASGTLVVRLRAPLFTGNARPTFDAILAAVAAAEPKPVTVELDCRAVTRATVPYLDGLHQLSRDLAAERVELRLVGMRPDVHAVSSTEKWFAAVDPAGPSEPDRASDL